MKILNIINLKLGSVEDILKFCQKTIMEGRGAFFIPMNPIKVIKARKFADFQDIIDHADWVFPDAWGISWAASFLYKKKIPLIPGYKLMFSMIEQSEKDGCSVYLLGTTNEILEIASKRLIKTHPELKIVGTHHGFFEKSDEKKIFKEIADLKPNYVFVAMGEYKQEKVIWRLRQVYPFAIFMGVGGSIDLIAGKQPSPPEWIRRNHLEWLFRLFRQPFRAPRFKALPIFFILVCLTKFKFLSKEEI